MNMHSFEYDLKQLQVPRAGSGGPRARASRRAGGVPAQPGKGDGDHADGPRAGSRAAPGGAGLPLPAWRWSVSRCTGCFHRRERQLRTDGRSGSRDRAPAVSRVQARGCRQSRRTAAARILSRPTPPKMDMPRPRGDTAASAGHRDPAGCTARKRSVSNVDRQGADCRASATSSARPSPLAEQPRCRQPPSPAARRQDADAWTTRHGRDQRRSATTATSSSTSKSIR